MKSNERTNEYDYLNQSYISKKTSRKQWVIGGLGIAKDTDIRGHFAVSQNATIGGTLAVSGKTTLEEVQVNQNLRVEKNTNLIGTLDIGSTLRAKGANNYISVGTTANPTETNGGMIRFTSGGVTGIDGAEIRYVVPTSGDQNNALRIGGQVNGNRELLKDLTLDAVNIFSESGNFFINSITVNNESEFYSSLKVGGPLSTSSSFTVDGSASFKQDITVLGTGTVGTLLAYRIQTPASSHSIQASAENQFFHVELKGSNLVAGTGYKIRSERTGVGTIMTLLSDNGYMGIGTDNPTHRLTVMGDVMNNGGWYRVKGEQGYYFEDYGGGWYMTDTTWIKAYNSKNIYTPGEIRSGHTYSFDSNMTRRVINGGVAITNGGDGASATDANLRLHSWYGIGFASTITGQPVPQGENAVFINVRNGDITARGVIKGARTVIPVGADLWAT